MNFDMSVILDNWPVLAKGLVNTALICAASLPLGLLVGAILAVARLRGGRAAAIAVAAYIELIRNIPFLIQVFLLFYVLPMFGVRLNPLTVSVIALTAYGSAYFAEILRGALQSISPGQTEAGYALGLRYMVILRKILLPQVVGYILPASTNMTISLIKETAVLSTITVPELTYMAQNVIGRTFAPIEIFTVIALLYWALTGALAALSRWLETHMQPHLAERRGT